MTKENTIPQAFQIGDYVSKKTSAKYLGAKKAFSPLKGTVVDTRVKHIKTKKGSKRQRVYDVIFEKRSTTPEKDVASHMLQKIERPTSQS